MGPESKDILDMRRVEVPGWVAIAPPNAVTFHERERKWETLMFAAALAVVVATTAIIGLDLPAILLSVAITYGVGLLASRTRSKRSATYVSQVIRRSELEAKGWAELLAQMDECVQYARAIADSELVGTIIPENIGESLNAAMWECAELHMQAATHPEDQDALDAAGAAHEYLQSAYRDVNIAEAEASQLDEYPLPASPASPFESQSLHDGMAGLRRGIEEVSRHDKRAGS